MSIADKLTTIAENEQKIYDKGRTDEWSDFWDVFQRNGTRTNYDWAFVGSQAGALSGWGDETFKPKYDMYPTSLVRTFRYGEFVNFKEAFSERGLVFSTSNCTDFSLAFSQCFYLKSLPIIDMRKAKSASACGDAFAQCQKLETIDKLIFESTGTKIPTTFTACYDLKNLVIEGAIGVSINFQYSPLSVDSMKSVINALIDYSGTDKEGTCTVTLMGECWTALEASTSPYEDGLTENEALSWVDYVEELGWLIS